MAATTAASSNGETAPTGPVMLASPPSGQADQSPLIREYKTALGENGVVSFEQVVRAAFGDAHHRPPAAIRLSTPGTTRGCYSASLRPTSARSGLTAAASCTTTSPTISTPR
jgi:hypothetical protein